MRHRADLIRKVRKFLQRWTWVVLLLTVLSITALEVYEHLQRQIHPLNIVIEVIFYLTIIPLLIVSLLSYRQARTELVNRSKLLDAQRVLRQQLAGAQDWEEIYQILLQFPQVIAPLTGASFYIYNYIQATHELVVKWSLESPLPPYEDLLLGPDPYTVAPSARTQPQGFFISSSSETLSPSEQVNTFCFPLLYNNYETANLFLFFPRDVIFTPEQIIFLNEVALQIALTIERVHLRLSVKRQNEAIQAEHARIARHLHDTLGDNLAFLRLKLDQLAEQGAPQDIAAIQVEIERMRDIANTAYEQVRRSLSELHGKDAPDFAESLKDLASLIADRAGFEVKWIREGNPVPILPQTSRQLLLILREALRNVEKHAGASRVWIDLNWESEELQISIVDDGKGFDSDTAKFLMDHFGLRMIQERTAELGGKAAIQSSIEGGTKVRLVFPLEKLNQEHRFVEDETGKETLFN